MENHQNSLLTSGRKADEDELLQARIKVMRTVEEAALRAKEGAQRQAELRKLKEDISKVVKRAKELNEEQVSKDLQMCEDTVTKRQAEIESNEREEQEALMQRRLLEEEEVFRIFYKIQFYGNWDPDDDDDPRSHIPFPYQC